MSDKAQDVVDAVLGEQGGQHEHEHQHQDPPASSLVVGHSSISGLSPQGMVFSTETEIRREEYAQVGGRKGTDGHTEESGQSRLKWIRKESFGSEGVGSRGKASRDRYGWGNMPLNAIQSVYLPSPLLVHRLSTTTPVLHPFFVITVISLSGHLLTVPP